MPNKEMGNVFGTIINGKIENILGDGGSTRE